MVDDSRNLASSEAYCATLGCYQSAKSAAKLNVPGAATIADDLASNLPSRGPRNGIALEADAEANASTLADPQLLFEAPTLDLKGAT